MKVYITCRICHKDILETGFSTHVRTHSNPLSRNCNKWYKEYFHKECGYLCVCNVCDDEIRGYYPSDYEDHLAEHGIHK